MEINKKDVELDVQPVIEKPKDPNYWKSTKSLKTRRDAEGRQSMHKSEIVRMKKATFDEKI